MEIHGLNQRFKSLVDETTEIRIYNTLGQCVLSIDAGSEVTNTKRIDISGLPVGLYYVKVGKYFEKFIKIY